MLLASCGGATTPPANPTGLDDTESLKNLEIQLAKPMPEVWMQSTAALITDPVAICRNRDMVEQAKSESQSQLEKAKAALQDAGVSVQDAPVGASVVFSIRVLISCTGGGKQLIAGDVSAMPNNGAVAAKSDLFELSRFDAGKATLGLLRKDKLTQRMSGQ